jgi:hypothetical protein
MSLSELPPKKLDRCINCDHPIYFTSKENDRQFDNKGPYCMDCLKAIDIGLKFSIKTMTDDRPSL